MFGPEHKSILMTTNSSTDRKLIFDSVKIIVKFDLKNNTVYVEKR